MLHLLLTALLGLALWPAAGWSQPLEEKVREFRLDNGLQLLVVERRDTPTVAAYITIGVGSVDETSEERGVAHLLEHMLFKGTRTIGTRNFRREKPLLQEIGEVGAELDRLRAEKGEGSEEARHLVERLAELQEKHRRYVVKDEFARLYAESGGVGYNAFTSKDLTTYLVSLPANKLELWARLESDRMQNAVLREFYTEREVIKEERRRSVESSPERMLYENLLATAFTVHPYRAPIIGWNSDIAHLTLEETSSFLHRFYAPTNTVIALVGDVEAESAYRLVERYFGAIPPGTPVPPVAEVEPPQQGEKRVHVRFDAEPRVALAFHKPTLPAREDYVFDLIDQVLGQGRTSRLYRSLVLDRQLASSVSTYTAPGSRYPNLFVISAIPRHPHTVKEVEEAILAELERLAHEPVTPAELEQARTRLQADRLRFLKGNGGLARMLTYYQTVAGDWRYLVRYDEAVAAITPEEVRAVAAAYLTAESRTVATLGKEGELP